MPLPRLIKCPKCGNRYIGKTGRITYYCAMCQEEIVSQEHKIKMHKFTEGGNPTGETTWDISRQDKTFYMERSKGTGKGRRNAKRETDSE